MDYYSLSFISWKDKNELRMFFLRISIVATFELYPAEVQLCQRQGRIKRRQRGQLPRALRSKGTPRGGIYLFLKKVV